MLGLRKRARKHYMAVKRSADFIGNRLVQIVAVDENIVERGYGTFVVRSGALKEFRNHVENARGISALSRSLPG